MRSRRRYPAEVRFRLTNEEVEMLDDMVDSTGMDRGALMRALIRQWAESPVRVRIEPVEKKDTA